MIKQGKINLWKTQNKLLKHLLLFLVGFEFWLKISLSDESEKYNSSYLLFYPEIETGQYHMNLFSKHGTYPKKGIYFAFIFKSF